MTTDRDPIHPGAPVALVLLFALAALATGCLLAMYALWLVVK
jgi:hypothetical protein